MSVTAHMKKRPTNKKRTSRGCALKSTAENIAKTYCLSEQGHVFKLPLNQVQNFLVLDVNEQKNARRKILLQHKLMTTDEVFKDLDKKYTKAGVLLRSVRTREGLSQIDFASRIDVKQGDLSKIENGKRPIGKEIAKRIENEFNVNYRFFLE